MLSAKAPASIVYDPTKKDNEEQSVLVFAEFAKDVGLVRPLSHSDHAQTF